MVVWGVVTILAILAGAITFAYTYITDSDTLAALVNAQVPAYLPGSRLDLTRVQLRPFVGEVGLKGVRLYQKVDGKAFPVASVPWVQIRCDLQKLWRGKVEPREVILAQPTLRVTRRADGSWNLQGLLADPWPDTPNLRPTVRVSKGTVELADGHSPAMVLHDVELVFEPAGDGGQFTFHGSAQGDAFERLTLAGTLDTRGGRLCLTRGDLEGLNVTGALRDRLPPAWQAAWDDLGLTGGVLDVGVESLRCGRAEGEPAHYAVNLGLRDGVWNCKKLPFPLNDVSASARVEDGRAVVARADAFYGKTRVRLHRATLDADDPEGGPLDLDVSITELELDETLRRRLPPDLRTVWDDFAPEGRTSLGWASLRLRARRAKPGDPIAFAMTADLLDVAVRFRLFPFPVEGIHGRVAWAGDQVTIQKLEALVGGKPLTASGIIRDPGKSAKVDMTFEAGALEIDEEKPFVRALPDDIRDAVTQFHPKGTVRGTARLRRDPSPDPLDEMGLVRVDADLEPNDGFTIRWDGLPYPVRLRSGKLGVHPDHCTFQDVLGSNGEAQIAASGRVDVLGAGRYAADVLLSADRLRFDRQLRDALPQEWQSTWRLLSPRGYSRLESHVRSGYADPKRPDLTWLRLRVGQGDEASLKLVLTPAPGTPAGPGGRIELPTMQDVRGTFVYDNGLVTLTDVDFNFREAPVRIRTGRVTLEPTGKFDLRVEDLRVHRLRLDAELRQIMPKLMADFAARLDDGRPFAAHGNLGITWSGRKEDPAACSWDHAAVFFQDNAILTGVPLEHIHGQIDHVHGRFDGRSLSLAGAVDLDSVVVAGQQISGFSSPITVGGGKVVMADIRAKVLGGEVLGGLDFTLDETPAYHAGFRVWGADLARYAQTQPGRQDYSGKVSGRLVVNGQGSDLRRLNGEGELHLVEGDVGKLPLVLRVVAKLNLLRRSQADFDAADAYFTIEGGEVRFGGLKITGDTISLRGSGTADPHGNLDIDLDAVAGRDERPHVLGLNDATREATGQLLTIHVAGPYLAPDIKAVVLPAASRPLGQFVRRLGDRKDGANR
jgi:hypothetical protein